MESFRPPTGGIRVVTRSFSVLVLEDSIEVKIGDVTVHSWKPEPAASVAPSPERSDLPSPRSQPRANRRRGSR